MKTNNFQIRRAVGASAILLAGLSVQLAPMAKAQTTLSAKTGQVNEGNVSEGSRILQDRLKRLKQAKKDWQSKDSQWKETQIKNLQNKWSSHKEELMTQAEKLKSSASSMTNEEKANLQKAGQAQLDKFKAWRTAHPHDSQNLDNLVTKAKNQIKTLSK